MLNMSNAKKRNGSAVRLSWNSLRLNVSVTSLSKVLKKEFKTAKKLGRKECTKCGYCCHFGTCILELAPLMNFYILPLKFGKFFFEKFPALLIIFPGIDMNRYFLF